MKIRILFILLIAIASSFAVTPAQAQQSTCSYFSPTLTKLPETFHR